MIHEHPVRVITLCIKKSCGRSSQPLKGSLAKRSRKNVSDLSNPNFKSMKMLQSWAGLSIGL
jgi:hypothetical protein